MHLGGTKPMILQNRCKHLLEPTYNMTIVYFQMNMFVYNGIWFHYLLLHYVNLLYYFIVIDLFVTALNFIVLDIAVC